MTVTNEAVVTIDFETRSPFDIKTRGGQNYAKCPYTEIMCCSVKLNDNPSNLWIDTKFLFKIDPDNLNYDIISENEFIEMVMDADKVVAHNSMFEFRIWNHIGVGRRSWPALPLEKLHDTMAQCGYHALPLGMGDAGEALGLPITKDKVGHRMMLKLCKPRNARKKEMTDLLEKGWVEIDSFDYQTWKTPQGDTHFLWNELSSDLEILFNYCGKDADSEYLLHTTLAELPEIERRVWLLDQKINIEGVHFDRETVTSIVDMVTSREDDLLKKFQELTNGEVSGPRSYVDLKNWVNKKLDLELTGVGKSVVTELLGRKKLFERKDPDGKVKEVLNIKAELSKSSVAKFRNMLLKADPEDDRLRDMFQFFGASTGRFSGRDVQLHSLPRDSYKTAEYEQIAGFLKNGDITAIEYLFDAPFLVASRCIRGSINAVPGCQFICFDFSSIEAVVNAFLARDRNGMDTFFNNLDPYRRLAAEKIFNVEYEDIKKEGDVRRQVGKCGELALGFLGGIGAFASMSNVYGIDLETLPAIVLPNATADEIEGSYGAEVMAELYLKNNPDTMSFEAAVACDVIKQKWRQSHPEIVSFGRGLESAAKLAVKNPGKVYKVNQIRYCYSGGFLKAMLPSGRLIHYYDPKIKSVETDFGVKETLSYRALRVVDGKTTRQFTRIFTYSGKLLENIVQGVARDLLVFSMLNLDDKGFKVCLHVHDEVVVEVEIGSEFDNVERVKQIYLQLPWWAKGWPVKAGGWVGPRFQK